MLWSELSLIQGMVEQPWGNRCDDSQNWGRSEFLWQHYRRGWASSASHHLDGSCRRRVALGMVPTIARASRTGPIKS